MPRARTARGGPSPAAFSRPRGGTPLPASPAGSRARRQAAGTHPVAPAGSARRRLPAAPEQLGGQARGHVRPTDMASRSAVAKQDGIFVCRLTAHPHVNPAGRGLVSPYCLSQNGCLAEARPRNEQRHGPVPAALEQPNEPQSRYLDVEGTRQAERAGQQRHGRRRLSGGQMAGRHRLVSRTWSVHRVHALRSTAPHTLMLTAYTASVQEDCRLQQRSLVAWFAPGQYLVRSLGGDPCAALAPEYENVHWGGPLPLPR